MDALEILPPFGRLDDIKEMKKKSKIMENKNTWSKILHFIITVLTAIATTFGVTSCMGV